MKEYIKGGLAEGKSAEDIAKLHGVSVSDIESQIKKGIKIEHEHSPDDGIAEEIAKDHLTEFPYYYDFLEAMEKEMEIDYDNEEYGKDPEEEESEEDKKDNLKAWSVTNSGEEIIENNFEKENNSAKK
jgi:hypothetical protein